MRSIPRLAQTFAVVCLAAAPLHADDAADALLRSRVYRELHRMALQQWERIYSFGLSDLQALSGPRYKKFTRPNVVPAFVFYAGRNAVHQRQYKLARERLVLAERLAKDTGQKPLAREVLLWRLACERALGAPDAAARFDQAHVESEKAEEVLLLAYLLDKLGLERGSDHKELKELYSRGCKLAEKQKLSTQAARHRAWLAFRIEKETTRLIEAVERGSLGPDAAPPAGAPVPTGKPDAKRRSARHITSTELYDAARLDEISIAYARRAYDLAPARTEAHVRAALRLGLYDEARRRAHAAASAERGDGHDAKLKIYTWRILKAAGDEGAGRKGALLELRRRLINPGFAAENKYIYYAVAQALAEVLLDTACTAEALEVAEGAVRDLEKNYKTPLSSGQLLDYYEKTRPVYGTLAHACYLNGKARRSFEIYGLVYPWHRRAWLAALRTDPLFCVRYTALLFERNDFALARELVYNYKDYGLLAPYPLARQIHSASAVLEYLYRK